MSGDVTVPAEDFRMEGGPEWRRGDRYIRVEFLSVSIFFYISLNESLKVSPSKSDNTRNIQSYFHHLALSCTDT